NVGYAAKLHFSSFELSEKLPSLISFISISCGIYALVYDELSTKFASSTLVILGVIGIYVSLKSNNDQDFKAKGDELTDLFNELKHLMAE
ncbi:SLATT domain-containing protein, partial [Pseudoalteromonas sp. SIMBA_153]